MGLVKGMFDIHEVEKKLLTTVRRGFKNRWGRKSIRNVDSKRSRWDRHGKDVQQNAFDKGPKRKWTYLYLFASDSTWQTLNLMCDWISLREINKASTTPGLSSVMQISRRRCEVGRGCLEEAVCWPFRGQTGYPILLCMRALDSNGAFLLAILA